MNFRPIVDKASVARFRLIEKARFLCSRVNERPIIILGNQKSGTSAVVSLLGEAAGRSYTNDVFVKFGDAETRVLNGDLTFGQFVEQARYYFGKTLVKDPGLTFMLDHVEDRFPDARYVFVIRNPFDNIRGILNRVRLPGDLEDLRSEHWEALMRKRAQWRPVLDGLSGGFADGTYIERLAKRSKFALDLAAKDPSKRLVVRYEDFVQDKIGVISRTLAQLELEPVNDISKIADKPFQPPSQIRLPPPEFFGSRNFGLIAEICGAAMLRHGYRLQS